MGCHDFGRVKAGNSTALVNGNTATESAEICKRQGYNIPRKAACSIGLYALAATWHNIKHKIRGVSPPCPYPACSSCPKHAEFLDTGPFSTWSQPWTPETPIYHAGTKIYHAGNRHPRFSRFNAHFIRSLNARLQATDSLVGRS